MTENHTTHEKLEVPTSCHPARCHRLTTSSIHLQMCSDQGSCTTPSGLASYSSQADSARLSLSEGLYKDLRLSSLETLPLRRRLTVRKEVGVGAPVQNPPLAKVRAVRSAHGNEPALRGGGAGGGPCTFSYRPFH